MCEEFNKSLLKSSVAQICLSMGWHSMQRSTQAILTDVLERYMRKLSKTAVSYCENYSRTVPSLDDIGLAFDEIGIPLDELKDYVTQVDAVPFSKTVGSYPRQRSSAVSIALPNPDELASRSEYYDDHLPALNKVSSLPTESANGVDDHAQLVDDGPVTSASETSLPIPLKLPLMRKRSANSPPYSPVEPKRLNLDAEHYNSDLTRPDLKVSTPKGLAPISTAAEVTSNQRVSPASTKEVKRHPQALDIATPLEEKTADKVEKTKSFHNRISSPKRNIKVASPVKVIAPTPDPSKFAAASPKDGSRKIPKEHLKLDLPNVGAPPSKTSPKLKSAQSSKMSPAKKKQASPMKTPLKKSPITPLKAQTDLSMKLETSKLASPSSVKTQIPGDIAKQQVSDVIDSPKIPLKTLSSLPASSVTASPETKKTIQRSAELLSPTDKAKKPKDDKQNKVKKKKSSKLVPSLSISSVLFSDPLPSVSLTLKKPSPSDPSDVNKSHSVFKSPSPIKSPNVKSEKDAKTQAAVPPKKKKKKAKERDREDGSKSSSGKSGSQSDKKTKKDKSKDISSKIIPKLTLKMGLPTTEGELGPSPKLIIKTGSPPAPKTPKPPSQGTSTLVRAPTLPSTTPKLEKTDDALSRGVFTETLTTTLNQASSDLYYCPTCGLPDNGSPMIGCDTCDQWFHWPCVSVFVAPKDDESWFCPNCALKQAKKKKKKKKRDE